MAKKQTVLKSRRNLTRFTYESSDFLGWRLSISRNGHSFTKYYGDLQHGSGEASLAIAESKLAEVKEILDSSRTRDGKLTATTIKKVNKILGLQ